jgi:hypothetical protein
MADSLISGRDLGARGDNVADDTAALQAALDRVAEGKVATLYLPAGTYRITAPLVLRCPLTVAATIRGESGAGGGGARSSRSTARPVPPASSRWPGDSA